jgi:very-short-patch-repair endonuclease/predicted transcriptional regulator of viral defense system
VVALSPAFGEEPQHHSADQAVQALAGRQHGVVSREQVRAAGLSRQAIHRRIEAGWLVRLHQGVYAVGHTALTPKSHLLAAVYAGGRGALASHRAAGGLWVVLRGAQPIEVTAPTPRTARQGIVLHRSRCIDPEDRAVIDGIPVTSLARTLVDLADVLLERRLADAVHEAEVRQLFDMRTVERVLDRLPGRKGRHRLRRVLAAYRDVQPFTRSEAERRVLELCETHGLPRPQVNVGIAGYEVDFYWPEAKLVLEFDGAATHLTRRAFRADRARDRALAARGIHVVRATWRDLDAGLGRELDAILAARLHR